MCPGAAVSFLGVCCLPLGDRGHGAFGRLANVGHSDACLPVDAERDAWSSRLWSTDLAPA